MRKLDSDADRSKAAIATRAYEAGVDELREITAADHRLNRELARLGREIDKLQRRAVDEAEKALRRLRQTHVDVYLRSVKIRSATIPGIGTSLVAALAASGISTAADFTGITITPEVALILRNGTRVRPRGIGMVKAQALDVWRREAELDARLTQPTALPKAEHDAIYARYAQNTQSLVNDQAAARARAAAKKDELHQKWARIQADIAREQHNTSARFARLRAEREPELAAARQQAATTEWRRDFAKRQLDSYRLIRYRRYLRKMITG